MWSFFILVSQNLKDHITESLAYHTTEELQELFDKGKTTIKHIIIGEGCGNGATNELVFSGFNSLESMVVKPNYLMFFKSVKISDNPQLKTIFITDDDLRNFEVYTIDDSIAYMDVESIVIESMIANHSVDWIFLNFMFLFLVFKETSA